MRPRHHIPNLSSGSKPLQHAIEIRIGLIFKCFKKQVNLTVLAGWMWMASTTFAAPLQVTRVEPPNWWIGSSCNPVHLLIYGQHLSGAHIEAPTGFGAGPTRTSENGTYLFWDLRIPDDCQPGNVLLRVVRDGGTNRISFPLMARPQSEGRFQGISPEDVIYEIMIDRFADGDPTNDDLADCPGLNDRNQPRRYHGGDFQGVINHLDYLKELGVTTLWLTPWYQNPNRLEHLYVIRSAQEKGVLMAHYHGYNAVNFYATDEHFGDLQLLRKLVGLAHTNGLKVIQDQVINQTDPCHPWVTNPPTPTWFNGTVANHLTNTYQTWTTVVSNPPPDLLKATLEGWFFGAMPDLNQNDSDEAAYQIQNSLWWIDMSGVDAIRLDALPYVPRAFWSRWTAALKSEHPSVTIVGEMWDGDPKRVAFFQGGKARFDGVDSGVDTLFDFPLCYAIRDVFARRMPMTRLTQTLAGDANYVDATRLVTFLGLHDQMRFLNERGATIDGLKLAFTFLLTTRGTPLIYYGDEIGMRGGENPDNRRDFPGGWPEDAQNAFESSARTPEQEEIHAHVTKLLHLRKELPALRRGRVVNLSVNRATYAFARVTPGNWAIVLFNNSLQQQSLQVPLSGLLPTARTVTDRLGGLGTINVADNTLRIWLPPRTAALLTP